MFYQVVLLGTFLCFNAISWAEVHKYDTGNDHDKAHHKDYEKKQDSYTKQYQYQGKYGGSCGRDGFYYLDESSFVICSNSNAYVQPCAPGSKNSGLHGYQEGRSYNYHELCDVNLVDRGYGVLFGADKVTGYNDKRSEKKDHGTAITQYKKEYASYGKVEKGVEPQGEGYYEPEESHGYHQQEGYATKEHYTSESKRSDAEYGKVDSKAYTNDKEYKESHKVYGQREDKAYREHARYDEDKRHYEKQVDVHYGESKEQYQRNSDGPYGTSEYGYHNVDQPYYASQRDHPGRYDGPSHDPHGYPSYMKSSYIDSAPLYTSPRKDRVSHYASKSYEYSEKPRHAVYNRPDFRHIDGPYEESGHSQGYKTGGSSYKKKDYDRSHHGSETYSIESHNRKDQLGYTGAEKYAGPNEGYGEVNTYDSIHNGYEQDAYDAKKPRGYDTDAAPGYERFEHSLKDGYHQEEPY